MTTFLTVLAIGLACAAIVLSLAVAIAVVGADSDDHQSGRCGEGTTRVEYRHGKTTEHVCERTPQ